MEAHSANTDKSNGVVVYRTATVASGRVIEHPGRDIAYQPREEGRFEKAVPISAARKRELE
ncbi:MAG: hypothetical protein ABI321_22005 [Polyangia bacterium]